VGSLLFVRPSIREGRLCVNYGAISRCCMSSWPTETYVFQTYSIIRAEISEVMYFARVCQLDSGSDYYRFGIVKVFGHSKANSGTPTDVQAE